MLLNVSSWNASLMKSARDFGGINLCAASNVMVFPFPNCRRAALYSRESSERALMFGHVSHTFRRHSGGKRRCQSVTTTRCPPPTYTDRAARRVNGYERNALAGSKARSAECNPHLVEVSHYTGVGDELGLSFPDRDGVLLEDPSPQLVTHVG